MLLTVTEVSKILRVNRNTVYNLIKSGELPHVDIGSIKVRESSLEEYLDQIERR